MRYRLSLLISLLFLSSCSIDWKDGNLLFHTSIDTYYISYIGIGIIVFVFWLIIAGIRMLPKKPNITIDHVSKNGLNTLSITSATNMHIRDVSIELNAKNDTEDWIILFFTDNNQTYYEMEKIGEEISLISHLPHTINYFPKGLAYLTMENLKTYIETSKSISEMQYPDYMNDIKNDFLNPGWQVTIYVNGFAYGTYPVNYEVPEVQEYLKNLNN